MDDTDDSAVPPKGASLTSTIITCAASAVIVLAACKPPPPPEGIYVDCHSNGANTYYKWTPGPCLLPGGLVTGCYTKVPAEHLTHCYGNDEWLSMAIEDGETGETGELEGIAPANWPIHDPSLTYIRKNCTNHCIYLHNDKSGEKYTCEPNNWIIHGAQEIVATELEDPGKFNCNPHLGNRKRHPSATEVVQANTDLWTSDSSAITLTCSNFGSCADLFDENITHHLLYSGATPLGDNEAEADYLVTSSTTSSSVLRLRIANSITPSHDSNAVGGRIEYTAPDCGQPTCPFYLGNLTITNTSDSWNVRSEAHDEDLAITNINIRLRRPTLGVWRPSTGEVYFGDQMLDLQVDFDLAVGDETTSTVTQYGVNSGGVFGHRHGSDAIVLTNLSMSDGYVEGFTRLDYDSVAGSPPVASFTLSPSVLLGPNVPGLLVSSISENSTDPDADLGWKLWFVDGHQVAPGYLIPPGLHTIRLEVRDSRLAFDEQEQLILITHLE